MKLKIIEISDELSLKPLEEGDEKHIFAALDSERGYFGEWLPFVEFTKSEADSLDFVKSVLSMPEAFFEPAFTIWFKSEFAGLVGFKETDFLNKKSEIGYWLREEFQKKGIMTRSVAALLRFAFEERGINRIQIKVAPENLRSRGIPERLGFKFEGIERDSELVKGDLFRDAEVYSMLKREVVLK